MDGKMEIINEPLKKFMGQPWTSFDSDFFCKRTKGKKQVEKQAIVKKCSVELVNLPEKDYIVFGSRPPDKWLALETCSLCGSTVISNLISQHYAELHASIETPVKQLHSTEHTPVRRKGSSPRKKKARRGTRSISDDETPPADDSRPPTPGPTHLYEEFAVPNIEDGIYSFTDTKPKVNEPFVAIPRDEVSRKSEPIAVPFQTKSSPNYSALEGVRNADTAKKRKPPPDETKTPIVFSPLLLKKGKVMQFGKNDRPESPFRETKIKAERVAVCGPATDDGTASDSSVGRPTKGGSHKRNVVFDAERHCGVVIGDKPCLRSLTCKTHAVSLRRAVPGRSKPFDVLLAERRRRPDDEVVTDPVISLPIMKTEPEFGESPPYNRIFSSYNIETNCVKSGRIPGSDSKLPNVVRICAASSAGADASMQNESSDTHRIQSRLKPALLNFKSEPNDTEFSQIEEINETRSNNSASDVYAPFGLCKANGLVVTEKTIQLQRKAMDVLRDGVRKLMEGIELESPPSPPAAVIAEVFLKRDAPVFDVRTRSPLVKPIELCNVSELMARNEQMLRRLPPDDELLGVRRQTESNSNDGGEDSTDSYVGFSILSTDIEDILPDGTTLAEATVLDDQFGGVGFFVSANGFYESQSDALRCGRDPFLTNGVNDITSNPDEKQLETNELPTAMGSYADDFGADAFNMDAATLNNFLDDFTKNSANMDPLGLGPFS